MQGDFPLFTKKKLEQIHKRFVANREPLPKLEPKKEPIVQSAKQGLVADPQQPQPAKKPFAPNQNNNNPERKPFVPRPEQRKKDEPAKPIDDDMLKLLASKFKKG